MIKSTTAYKVGYGSAQYRSVKGLSKKEKTAIQTGGCVWFVDGGTHHMQSGYKVCTCYYSANGHVRFDSREPNAFELNEISKAIFGLEIIKNVK